MGCICTEALEMGAEAAIKRHNAALPEEARPVLAFITVQDDLGLQHWREVVYHNGERWCPYAGSDTFGNGEQVSRWVYADLALP